MSNVLPRFFRDTVNIGHDAAIKRVQASSLTFRIRRVCYHSNETRAPIANPLSSAQLGGTSYHSQRYSRVRAIVWECGEGQTDTQTDGRDHNTVHFAILCQMLTYG